MQNNKVYVGPNIKTIFRVDSNLKFSTFSLKSNYRTKPNLKM